MKVPTSNNLMEYNRVNRKYEDVSLFKSGGDDSDHHAVPPSDGPQHDREE